MTNKKPYGLTKKILSLNKTISIFTLLLSTIVLSSCAPQKSNAENDYAPLNKETDKTAKVIYGNDDRLDYYQVTDDRIRSLADSTVALIETADIQNQGSLSFIKASSFQSSQYLCSTERFIEQDTGAFCSGSLVGEDLIMTAGHCITSQSDCSSTSFVFGYSVKQAGSIGYRQVESKDIYKCASIINRKLEDKGIDYALIKLDRKVVDKKALKIRRTGEPAVNDELIVVGHPSGLPTKITGGGKIRSLSSNGFFTANTDTYGGNSGSAVFSANTGLIEGILVRGENDFIRQGNCYVSYKCTDSSCRGEDITKISALADLIPETSSDTTGSSNNNSDLMQFTSNERIQIPDNMTVGISSEIQVDQVGQNAKDIKVSVDISHTYKGDLAVKLVVPSGQVIALHSRSGGSVDNLKKSYVISSKIKEKMFNGIYKLIVQDLAAQDIGSLNSWKIEIK